MIDWNDLRYFVAVARAGTLAGAAKELRVDQTTVGRRLAALEAALGTKLFARTPDGWALTGAGERSLAIAADLDERVGALEAGARGADERLAGVVRVAMNETFAVGFLLERLVRLRERHPDIRLEIVTSNQSVNLLRREADIAVRVAPRALPEQQDLVVRKLAAISLSLYATRAYLASHPPVRVDDGLRGHDVVLFEQEMAGAPPGRWLARAATKARAPLRVSSLLSAAAIAASGAAMALVPCFLAAKHPTLVAAVPRAVVANDAWLLVHPILRSTARVQAVVKHIVSETRSAASLLDSRRRRPRARSGSN